ncbi:MAG TPA: hypothetical protein VFW87_14065 [Pirellulales bacterium]|nr:hypothetical protein [Pirellulales bacterium]
MKALSLLRSFCPPFFCLLLFAATTRADDEIANYEIHEFSLWGLDPTLEQVNQLQHYPSALPGVVETERSRVNEQQKLTPLGLITFHGEPVKDLEIDLRVQSGRFLGHWPPAESKSGRLRWLDLATVPEAAKDAFMAAVDDKHWFVAGRQLDGLFAQGKSRTERFLAYDCELKYEVPLQLTGGPDRYQLANRGKTPLLNVLILAPAENGLRIGRIEKLDPTKPAAAKADAKPADRKPGDSKPGDSKPADAPAAAEKKVESSATEAPKSVQPASARTAEKAAAAAPDKEAGEAKPADAKPDAAKPDAAQAEKVEAKQPAATPEAASAPGAAAQPAPTATAQPAPLPGVDVEMSQPLAKDSDELKAVNESLTASLKQVGLTGQEAELLLGRGLNHLVETKEMLVLFRLPPDAIEERLPLVAYPAPRKTIRTALVLVRNLDPKIKEEVQKLIAELGAEKYSVREAAEKRLLELGRLAVPALKEAAKPANKDLEVVFRAERILLAQNEKLEGT